jgi:hypothetical protein
MSTGAGAGAGAAGPPGASRAGIARAVGALLLLNVALSCRNWWPTPFVVPDHRIAPELVLGWCLLLAFVRIAGMTGPRLLGVAAAGFVALVVGRYAEVTVPALFGRPINLYWDGQQIPRFLSVTAGGLALLQSAAALLALGLLGWGMYRAARAAIGVVARDAAPAALRSRAALAASAAALVLVGANYAGVQATWPVVAKPVLPTYARQARLLFDALVPGRLAVVLPASPAFDGGLAGLHRADVTVLFLESYGAVVFDDPTMRPVLAAARTALERGIAGSGRRVVSAFVTSPTFGGGSELAHLGLLSGLDLADPARHDLLLTSDRPTLVGHFRAHGYRTYGLYPALSWDWPEKAFYGFDTFIDGPSLGYAGPKLGFWLIPDQVAAARFDALFPPAADGPPRLLFFPTISSHIPFRPVPPYQPDWERLLTARPYDDAPLAAALADEVDWLDLHRGYVGQIAYAYEWVGGWLGRPRPRPETVVIVGDHQPASSVSGPGARWDVPVHVVTADPVMLERLVAMGFVPGLEPAPAPLGAMHALTAMLLTAFDARGAVGVARSPGDAVVVR